MSAVITLGKPMLKGSLNSLFLLNFAQLSSTPRLVIIVNLNLFLAWQFVGHLLKIFDIVDLPYSNPKTEKIDETSSLAWKYRIITMSILLVIVMPLNLQKKLSTLRYFSALILLIVFFTIGVSLVQSVGYYENFKSSKDYELNLLYNPFEIKWLQGLATMMLSFNCQITFFYIRAELRNKTRRRVKKVLRNVILLEFVFYLTIAVAGYISLGSKMVPGIYTLRRSIEGSKDYVMKGCQIAFVAAAVLHIPLTLFPSREQIYIYYRMKRTSKNHFILTFVMTFLAAFVPCVYPDIVGLLGLLGGITVGSSGYILPTLLKLRSMDKLKWNHPKKLLFYCIFVLILFLCMSSTYVSIVYGGGGH